MAAWHGPQSHLERCLKRFGGGDGNGAPSVSWEHVSDELDRPAHHIGEACSKTRVFKRPNRSFERCEVFWCHAINVSKCWRSAIPRALTTAGCLRRGAPRWRSSRRSRIAKDGRRFFSS